jgi:hypothetical protein
MMTRPIESTLFDCDVVEQTVKVSFRPRTGNTAADMQDCSQAYRCKLFGDPPLPARFSAAEPVLGCPFHTGLLRPNVDDE